MNYCDIVNNKFTISKPYLIIYTTLFTTNGRQKKKKKEKKEKQNNMYRIKKLDYDLTKHRQITVSNAVPALESWRPPRVWVWGPSPENF